MINPLLSLAFSLYSSPGVYALLLGSGASRAAQIPTGWEIIMDLTRQVARLEGAGEIIDPERWYSERFAEPPNYSRLLALVAPSPTERQQILKGYFEPSEDERANGIKLPTAAHRAIAGLVASGTIRVILTTNFDRLLEQALDSVGVVPVVISTADAAAGALPIQHTRCTVIKLHGDYLDPRIRNTDEELASYDSVMDRMLDRILDDYGLIVCGWSGEWDVALRAAIERCPNRRFSTYWMSRGEPSERARQLIEQRQGQVIAIANADQAFEGLAEKIQALQEHHRPHPLSAPLAVASLKQYLPEERHRIRLYDLILGEIERCYDAIIDEERFPLGRGGFSDDTSFNTELLRQVRSYEALCEILLALFVHGCYWSETQHNYLWVKALERLAQPHRAQGQTVDALLNLRRYPALLLLYAGGMAALAAGRHHTLAALLTEPKVRDPYRSDETPLPCEIYPLQVFQNDLGKRLPEMERHFTPVSDWLFTVLREPLRTYAPEDLEYQRLFDRFEYMLALVHADVKDRADQHHRFWGPIGAFAWRYRHQMNRGVIGVIQQEIEAQQQSWPPLQAGLFTGSLERLRAVKTGFDELLSRGTAGWL
jgi:SIR2-like domain